MDTSNSLDQLLSLARRVNNEWCWPAAAAEDAIVAIAALNLAVLGIEIWEFDDSDSVVVKGWSQYELPSGEWSEVVRSSARLARDGVFEHSGNIGLWVNLTWGTQQEVGESSNG